jgi:uncharacterized protein (DUF433 family)
MEQTRRAAERRVDQEMLITVKEAAFAAGVSVKSVNQAIDRKHIRTRALRRATDRAKRGVGAGEAVYLTVSHVLAPEVRPQLYRSLRGKRISEVPRMLEMGGVVLDLARTIRDLEDRLDLLAKLRERVEIDPGVRGGEPVFRGTRIPIYAIARKMALGSTTGELLEDYPKLREQDLELARRYSKLYPRRGRPRGEWSRNAIRQGETGHP